MRLPQILKTISANLKTINAKSIVVGGSVRDHFLKVPIKDYDIEVYGLSHLRELEEVLAQHGSVNLVGKSFGVLKFVHKDDEYDFSFPRKESKVGEGHKGFSVEIDGSLEYKVASTRRDFTINALGYDVEDEVFLDPFGGLKDIEKKILRHIDDVTFVEDPLRVYRAVQFSSRFEFALDESTFTLCLSMVKDGMLEELAKERQYEEFKKLLLKAKRPSIGFELLKDLGINKVYFPELESIVGIQQSHLWHPEGDVWTHTMMALDVMSVMLEGLTVDSKERLKFMYAILCHDLGKATHTTKDKDGNIRAIGHEIAGVKPTKTFMYRLTEEHDFIDSLLPLVEHHLKPSQFYKDKSKAPAIRRLATKVNIEDLVLVAEADFLGRTTKESKAGIYSAGDWLLKRAKEIKVDKKPLQNPIQGRDLISLGLAPSPKFKEILDVVYDKIIEGEISTKDEALKYAKLLVDKI